MELAVIHRAFHRQRLSVRTSGFFKGPALLLNGVEVRKTKGQYLLANDSGAQVAVKLKTNFVDPIPSVELAGETVRLARPLTWYEYVWAALPITLVFVGGGLGGVIGVLGAMFNTRVIRSERSTAGRYCITAVSTVASFAVFFVVAIALRSVLDVTTR